MQDTSSNNRRLAKNTMSMYVRMLFLMFISFYTSRVVLRTLGAEDFGTYNVVGGVVVMFTFINSAMTTGTQRHLSFELGISGGNVGRIFSACLNIHLLFALFIIILSETVGLWFLNTKLNIPEGRISATNYVYQLSVLSCVFNIIRVPYNAAIIAYEKMSFYAYIGIVEGVLKLVIVYLLGFAPCDHLIFYAVLMSFVIAIVSVCYYLYCRVNFREIRYRKVCDSQLYKRLINFSGWALFGSVANMAKNQGVSFIINIFYGVTVNASIGIANQVNAAISQFVAGFQQAFNPQLTKVEATKDREYQAKLINMTAKYSYFVMLFCSLPILYNLDYILSFWLGKYPAYSKDFCFWIVIASLIDTISGPLWVTIFATGKIKKYQILLSSLMLLILPFGFFCGLFGLEPYYIFMIQSLLNLMFVFVRLYTLRKLIEFNIGSFVKEVFCPIAQVSFLVVTIIYISNLFIIDPIGFMQFIVQSLSIILCEIPIITYVGLSSAERNKIIILVKTRLFGKFTKI